MELPPGDQQWDRAGGLNLLAAKMFAVNKYHPATSPRVMGYCFWSRCPGGSPSFLLQPALGSACWGGGNRDDVVGLLMRIIGVVFLVAACIFGRLLWLDLAGIALALWLPSASKRQQA